MKENTINKLMESAKRQINHQMQKKQNNLGVKYGKGKNVKEMVNL